MRRRVTERPRFRPVDTLIAALLAGGDVIRRIERGAMSEAATDIERATLGLHSLEQYAPLIGANEVERILQKAATIRTQHVVHVSSTFYGGGVTEILTPLTLMMNAIGIETGWRMIQGTPGYFATTKKIHNALQGASASLSDAEKAVYEEVVFENALRMHLDDCDFVAVHDPQPLPLISHFGGREAPWLWESHVDMSEPDPATWSYLREFVGQYDAAIFSLPEYACDLSVNQHFIMPAIDPFSTKNAELTDTVIDETLARYGIPPETPLVVQISRFDRWKDPSGVIEAFRKAREQVDCTLVLCGNNAVDDPEGAVILDTVRGAADERVMIIAADDPVLVNALQRRAAVVLQKSLREGFGLTVTEAMWKGTVVIGGNVGGIRRQITDGENGFLVETVDQAAARIVQVLNDRPLRDRLGARAKETVRKQFLMSRLLEDWFDLIARYRAKATV
jgi:trehalose synthase